MPNTTTPPDHKESHMTAPRQPFFLADQFICQDNDSPIAVQLLGTVDYLAA